MYETIIIGGGPAGVTAGIYAARKKIKSLLIAESIGGQSIVSDKIENWIGEIEISGVDLATKMRKHLEAQQGIELKLGDKVKQVIEHEDGFLVKTEKGDKYTAKTLIVCSGGRRRKLDVPGAEKFDGRGLAYCSTCDAPLFKDKDVAVVGGGNAGLEAVIDLFPYAGKIYLLNRSDKPTGDPETLEEVRKNDKVQIINNAQTKEILGDKFVTGLKYKDSVSGEEKEIAIGGVFVEIGSVPNSEFVKSLVETNGYGEIILNCKTATTSNPKIFAAGDVTDDIYKQNNIAAGDGVRAALSAYNYLLNINKQTPAEGE